MVNMQPMHPRTLVLGQNLPYVRPLFHVSGCEMPYLLASMLWSIVSCHNRVSANQCHMTASRDQEKNSSRWYVLFNLSDAQLWYSTDHRLRKLYFRKTFLHSSHESFVFGFANLNLNINVMMYSYICSMVYVVSIVLKVITIPPMSCIVQLTAPCFLFEINTDAVRVPETKALAAIYIWDLLSSYCVVLQTFSCKGEGSSKRQFSTFTWNSQHPSSHMNKKLHKKIDQICCGQIYVAKNGDKDRKYCIGILNFIGF